MTIVKDQFNTEIFQMGMGNLLLEEGCALDARLIAQMEENAAAQGIAHVTAKVPAPDKDTLNTLLQNGYYLADTLTEYFFDTEKELPQMKHGCILRDAVSGDVEALKTIAGESFQIDRFHSDKHLNAELCDKYYERWIENSFHGFAEKVIVAELAGQAAGFTTGKTYPDSDIGHLVLSAVSGDSRGHGVYTSMIHEGISWIQRDHPEIRGVIAGTQLNNLAVQKAWIRLGFTIHGSVYVLHRYMGGENGGQI